MKKTPTANNKQGKRALGSYEKKNEHVDILLGTCIFFVITLFLFRGFIFSKGFAWGFGEFGINIGARDYISYLWNPLTQQPKVVNHMLIGILRYMLPLELGQRLPIMLSFTLMGASMFFAVYKLIPNNFGRFERFLSALFGGIFYMVNPFTVTRIPHGKMFFLYALIPLLFWYVYTTLEELGELERRDVVTKAIVTSLILFVMSISVRLPYLIPMIVAILMVQYRMILKNYKKFGLYVLSASILFVCLSCVWILPTFVPSGEIPSPSNYILTDSVLDLLSRHASILNVLTFNSHWYNGARELLLFSNSNLNLIRSIILCLIPLFAFFPLLVFKKIKIVHSLSIYALISTFLAKGTNPPISQFYEWFVFKSPLSSFGWMFRGAGKWSLLALTPSFILLSSFSVAWILRKVRGFMSNKHIILRKRGLHTSRSVVSVLFLILLIIPFFSGAPLLTGDVEGKMSTKNIPTEYEKLNNWLDSKDGGKILWYPSIPPWGAKGSSISYNFYSKYIINEGFKSKKLDPVYLLSQLGVQYIIVQKNDPTSEMIISLLEEKGENFIKSFGDLKVYELSNSSGMVYINNKVIEADDLTQLAATSQVVGYGTRLAFIFPNNLIGKETQGTDTVFISDSDLRIPSHIHTLFIAPFEKTYKWQPSEVWSKAKTNDPLHGPWHPYLERRGIENWDFDYGKGLVFTWGKDTLDIPFNIKENDNYDFFIRYFKNKDGGKIRIYLDGELIKEIDTKDQLNKFVWEKIKTPNLTKGNHKITLENVEGFNAVNVFSLIPEDAYLSQKGKLVEDLHDKDVIYLFEAESDPYRKNAVVSENPGATASNGRVLSINPDGLAWQEFEVLKNGSYKMAVRGIGQVDITVDNKIYHLDSQELNLTYFGPFRLERGEHKIEVTPSQDAEFKGLIRSWDFSSEKDYNQWKKATPENQFNAKYEVLHDKNALKTKLYDSTWGWKTIRSPLIPAEPGNTYRFSFKVKGQNAHGVHAKIKELNGEGEIIKGKRIAGIGSGDFDWKDISEKYTVKNASTKYIQLQIWHGHETKQPLPNEVWVDDVSVWDVEKEEKPCLDVIWLYSTENNKSLEDLFSYDESPAEVTSYEKINPTKYRVHVNASEPFMLSFAEGYDPLWVAEVKTSEGVKQYDPVPLYSVINGFWIDETGEYDILIKYKPQAWFYYGAMVSGATFIGCVGYLFYDWRRRKEDV